MAPFLRQVPARRMARMLRHQIVRKKRMKHDKTEWPTAPATPRSTSERYSWYVLGLLTLSQTRSEEHTSELQSLMRISYADFCWKKKQKTQSKTRTAPHKEDI